MLPQTVHYFGTEEVARILEKNASGCAKNLSGYGLESPVETVSSPPTMNHRRARVFVPFLEITDQQMEPAGCKQQRMREIVSGRLEPCVIADCMRACDEYA
jgi:hypothetical protein